MRAPPCSVVGVCGWRAASHHSSKNLSTCHPGALHGNTRLLLLKPHALCPTPSACQTEALDRHRVRRNCDRLRDASSSACRRRAACTRLPLSSYSKHHRPRTQTPLSFAAHLCPAPAERGDAAMLQRLGRLGALQGSKLLSAAAATQQCSSRAFAALPQPVEDEQPSAGEGRTASCCAHLRGSCHLTCSVPPPRPPQPTTIWAGTALTHAVLCGRPVATCACTADPTLGPCAQRVDRKSVV